LTTRFRACGIAFALIVSAIAARPDTAAPAAPAPRAPAEPREELSLDVEEANKPWKGDLDGMIERRIIRVLVVPSKTFYYVDKGVQRGITYEFVLQFEDDLNKTLGREKKLRKNLKVKVLFIPSGRAEIADRLNAGHGDIVASGLMVTEFGKKLADYSIPVYSGVDEIVVSAPGLPPVSSAEALSGKEVFVRKVSSAYEALTQLNQRLAAQKSRR